VRLSFLREKLTRTTGAATPTKAVDFTSMEISLTTRLMRFVVFLAIAASSLIVTNTFAQSFPDKPIRVIVPFAPGGLVDGSMRALAPRMSEALGQPVVVENRAGAGGVIGMADVARSPADGYTLLFGIESTALAPHIYKNPGFDPNKDFQPITQVLSVPIAILVHPSIPATTLRELAAHSKANPGKLSAGSGGQGTATHLCLEMLKSMADADYVHIPYKGAGPALTDFIAGQTQIFAVSTTLSLPQVRAGKARALAVAAPRRASNMPDIPTTAEAGFPGLEFSTWMGLLGPANLSTAIVTRVRDAALLALKDTANAKRFGDQGLDSLGTTPEEFRRFIAAESTKFGRAAALAGIKPE
jgi:tripartite-type tricarboxylate transporter receptor subunit TctC